MQTESLEQLLRGAPCMVELGKVLTVPAPGLHDPSGQAARMVQVQLVPSGRLAEARVANLGQGLARGVFAPPAPGDEVLVLLPGGDPNRAVVLGGLGNGASPNPVANDGLKVLLMHPGGVELRSADGLPAHGIVMAPLLQGLLDYVNAVTVFMAAAALDTSLSPGVAAAATAFQADPRVVEFVAELGASTAAGPPYASATNKVTT